MPDAGGDWWQKIGGAAGLAALAGVILDKIRTWKTADTDHAIKIDDIWDKQAKEMFDRQQKYVVMLETRNEEMQKQIDLERSKARNVETAAAFVSRENVDMRNLIHRALNYKLHGMALPAEIVAEMQKYDEV